MVPQVAEVRRFPFVSKAAMWAHFPIVAVVLVYAGYLLLRAPIARVPIVFGVGAALGVLGGVALVGLIRLGATTLVIDPEGVWFERRRDRRGLPWADIVGYEFSAGGRSPWLRILSASGRNLAIPRIPIVDVADHHRAISRALDRRLGPDAIRPALQRPAGTLAQKVFDYYGDVPPVYLEPGVRYRYAEPTAIQKEVGGRLIDLLAKSPFYIVVLACLGWMWDGNFGLQLTAVWLLAMMAQAIPIVRMGLEMIECRLLLRSLEDRFELREDGIYRGRGSHWVSLPSPRPQPGRKLLDQPLTRYGHGPFAYQMAPQFLEPDV